MPNNLEGQNISDTYQRLLQIQGGVLTDGTGSIITVPSASYAISASHEITYEVSSSHSETSDTATNLTGLNTSVAELNLLDGLSSADANIVLNANQNVRTADAPSFKNLLITSPMNSVGTPAIDLPTGAQTTIPHFQTNEGGPSLSIGDRGGNNIAIFGNSNDEAYYITQDGLFTGISATSTLAGTATLATNITATANNSGDETVYPTFVDGATGGQGIETDTGLTYNPYRGTLSSTQISATHITASGDISASGNIWSNDYHQFETTAKADSDDDTNWQGPNSYGIHTRADWNYDYGTTYSNTPPLTEVTTSSRALLNTGWRVPHGANYSASIINMQIYVTANSNITHADDDNFSCSMWYSKGSDLITETNVVDGNSGTFIQRHAATALSGQFKAADEKLFKYNLYHVSASVGIDLAPGAMLFPRMKTLGTNNFTTVVHWVVNYKKIPL